MLGGLLSCGGPEPKPKAGDCPPGGTDATWDNHARLFLTTWCTSCHSATVPEEARQGAPVGVDFDSFEAVQAWADRIAARSGDAPYTMPPSGGPSDEARALMVEWVACGLPGGEVGPEPACAGERRTRPGDLVVGSAADLDTFCVDHDAIEGDLVVRGGGDLNLDCLCEVGGDFIVDGAASLGSLGLANLGSVEGSVTVRDTPGLRTVELPALVEVGGGVLFIGNADLESVEIGRLETVPWDLGIEHNPKLRSSRPSRLFTVGGDLYFIGNDGMEAVALDRIRAVGGGLQISENPLLERIEGDAYALESVGLNLVIRDNDALDGFYGFEELATVGGDLVLDDNDAWESLDGFTRLESVGGELRIAGNDRLGRVQGFDFLASVDGSMILRDNPVLRFVDGFRILESVAGGVAGDELRLADLPGLESVSGLDALRSVDGLTIERTGLTTLSHLHAITEVERWLSVTDNPVLPPAEVDALVNAIGEGNIGGPVTNSGNGG